MGGFARCCVRRRGGVKRTVGHHGGKGGGFMGLVGVGTGERGVTW